MTHRKELTPQMLVYDDLNNPADTWHQPYLMFFQRPNYHSAVVNTDRLGFRLTHGATGAGEVASAGGRLPNGPVRLLVGSSTAFGQGATRDEATVASRLWTRYAPHGAWLNFAGRAYNSAQELLLFTLHRHLLPEVVKIVVFSGLNNLALSRLPDSQRGEHGAFHFCGEYIEQMRKLRERHRRAARGRFSVKRGSGRDGKPSDTSIDYQPPDLNETIRRSVELTERHLEALQLLMGSGGADVSFVLQPVSSWVREQPARQEALLFAELDQQPDARAYWRFYGEITTMEAGRRYAAALEAACGRKGVSFVDLNPLVAEAASPDSWLFVDRVHHTDEGADLFARLLAESLSLS